MPRSIDDILAEARRRLPARVDAGGLAAAMARGALVVDVRPADQRARDGELPGAVVVDRNVLEWRLDPAGDHRLPEVEGYDREIVIVCNEGYSSTLAAAVLQEIGHHRATDLEGGYQAWLRHTGGP